MKLDPGPLIAAACAGRPRHLLKDCPHCHGRAKGPTAEPGPMSRHGVGSSVGCVTNQDIADVLGMSIRQIVRWDAGGMLPADSGYDLDRLDRMATAAGAHVYELWPELAAAAVEEVTRECETCGELFVLTRKTKRFCDSRCLARSPGRIQRQREASARYERKRYQTDPEYREAKRARRREDYWENPHPERLKQRLRDRAKREAA